MVATPYLPHSLSVCVFDFSEDVILGGLNGY